MHVNTFEQWLANMALSKQHATERVERPGESQEALDGKKMVSQHGPQLHAVCDTAKVHAQHSRGSATAEPTTYSTDSKTLDQTSELACSTSLPNWIEPREHQLTSDVK